MKRSRAVRLTLVASSATIGALPACSGPRQDAMHCVERGTDRVVPDSLCGPATATTDRSGRPLTSTTHGGGFGGYAPYLWYFGGGMQRGYMRSGGYAPIGGAYYRSGSGYSVGRSGSGSGGADGASAHGSTARGSVSRGGFGATAAGHGGGG